MEYADYNSICSIIDIAGQAIFIPLLGMLQLPDANLIPFIIFTVFMRHMIKVIEMMIIRIGITMNDDTLGICCPVLDDVPGLWCGPHGSVQLLCHQEYCHQVC